jgi:fused signal recognition particle receptor
MFGFLKKKLKGALEKFSSDVDQEAKEEKVEELKKAIGHQEEKPTEEKEEVKKEVSEPVEEKQEEVEEKKEEVSREKEEPVKKVKEETPEAPEKPKEKEETEEKATEEVENEKKGTEEVSELEESSDEIKEEAPEEKEVEETPEEAVEERKSFTEEDLDAEAPEEPEEKEEEPEEEAKEEPEKKEKPEEEKDEDTKEDDDSGEKEEDEGSEKPEEREIKEPVDEIEEPEEKEPEEEREDTKEDRRKEEEFLMQKTPKEGKGFFQRLKDKFTVHPDKKAEEIKEAVQEKTEVKEESKKEEQKEHEEKEESQEEKAEEVQETKEQPTLETLQQQEPPLIKKPVEETKKGILTTLKETVTKKVLSESKFDELFFEIEVVLLENNVAVEVIEKIKQDLKKSLVDQRIDRGQLTTIIEQSLKESVEGLFDTPQVNLLEEAQKKKPYIIAFVGVNGSGKTTTIAKLTKYFQDNNLKPVIAAGDTFRAAAIQQLEEHATKLNAKFIKHDYGSDPAAVAFDAIKYAESKAMDVVLIDTAGRLHSNTNLMDEMKKIIRVAKPDLKLFVGESITGNDCVEQVKQFNEAIGVDGIILTKADVDEKGGAALSVSYVTERPILYFGMGQEYSDLEAFNKEKVMERIGLA